VKKSQNRWNLNDAKKSQNRWNLNDAKKSQRNCARLNLHCCPHGLPGPHYAPLWLRQKLTGYRSLKYLRLG